MALAIAALGGGTQETWAQGSLLKKLGGAASSLLNSKDSEKIKGVAEMATRLLGRDSLEMKHLQGEWLYSKPSIAFESENVMTTLGGAVAAQKLEGTLDALLQKVGFGAGELRLTLNADSTGCVQSGERETPFNWKMEKTDLILTFPLTQKEVRMNAKLSGKDLQVAMNAERLLTLITAIAEKAEDLGHAPQSINALIKDVKGMYVGLQFTPKKA